MKKINIIGCGNVGKTLAKLWNEKKVFKIGEISNRSYESSCLAVDFIGAGHPVDNLFKLDSVQALTGPIARGDVSLVSNQLQAIRAWNMQYGDLYRDLGLIALDLSRKQGQASIASMRDLSKLLNKPN